jgi:hypothetical protein
MSNSAVFFVPAARCCARVFAFLFSIRPDEGRVERRKGASFLLSRVSARDDPRL